MRIGLLAPVAFAVALSGCGSIGAIGISPKAESTPTDTVSPVAVSPVETSTLPPVAGAPATSSPIPGVASPGQPGMVASTNPTQPAASAGALGRTDLLGGWTIASSGDSCQLFMTLTSWTGGYRASTRGCASDVLKSISAWNLSGSQVVLAGSGGSPVATLGSSGGSRFDGQTGQGAPVSFYR
jgi:hypothetical protein